MSVPRLCTRQAYIYFVILVVCCCWRLPDASAEQEYTTALQPTPCTETTTTAMLTEPLRSDYRPTATIQYSSSPPLSSGNANFTVGNMLPTAQPIVNPTAVAFAVASSSLASLQRAGTVSADWQSAAAAASRSNRRLDVTLPMDAAVTDPAVMFRLLPDAGEDENDFSENRTQNFSSTLLNTSNPVLVEHTESSVGRQMFVIPTVLGMVVLLLVATGATVYRCHLRGRRRKVYFGGAHGTPAPKEFAEDRGGRGPVLLPDEIEMQVARSSLRARKALVLTSDVAVASETSTHENVVAENSPPSPLPPPYCSPPPYLPDVIIQNVHAS